MLSSHDIFINFVHQENGKEKKVKPGFDKTAFFLTGIWAALNGLWEQALAWVGYNILILIVISQMVRADWNGYIILFVVALLWLVYSYAYGALFSEWKIKKLTKKGFTTTNKIPDLQSKDVFMKVGIGYVAIPIIMVLYLISIPTVFDYQYASGLISDKDVDTVVEHFKEKTDSNLNAGEQAVVDWIVNSSSYVFSDGEKYRNALAEIANNNAVKLELMENHYKAALLVVDKDFVKMAALDYAENSMPDDFYMTIVSLDDKDLNTTVYAKYKKVFLGYDNPNLFSFSAFGKFISAVSRQYAESEDLFYRNIQKEYKEWKDYSDAYAIQDSINLIQRKIDKDFPGVYWCKEDFYIVRYDGIKNGLYVYAARSVSGKTVALGAPVFKQTAGMMYDNFWAWPETKTALLDQNGFPVSIRVITGLSEYEANILRVLKKDQKRLKKKMTPELKKVIATFEKTL